MPEGVTLAYVHGSSVAAAFMRSVVNAIVYDRGRVIRRTLDCQGLYVAALRNDVVANFLETDSEWLWFLDTDVVFPDDALYQMLEGTQNGERKILAAAYWTEYVDGSNALTWLDAQEDGFHPYMEHPTSGYLELAACGMGCTLIHRDVLEDVREARREDPDPWIWFGHDLIDTDGVPRRVGEDVGFCVRAHLAGHRVWGFCDVVVEHYKLIPQPKGGRDGPATREVSPPLLAGASRSND